MIAKKTERANTGASKKRSSSSKLRMAIEPLERRLLLSAVVVNTTVDQIDPVGSATVSLAPCNCRR